MEQHPVPQNVTTFQFRLIGDMTLKQFGYLAGGAILAYISYKLPLPLFLNWPLAIIFAIGGFGFAFVPIEERPMDVWVLSFFKSIYSPTQYIWFREAATKATAQPSTPPGPNTPAAPTQQTTIPGPQPAQPTTRRGDILNTIFSPTGQAPGTPLPQKSPGFLDWFFDFFMPKPKQVTNAPTPTMAPQVAYSSTMPARMDYTSPPAVRTRDEMASENVKKGPGTKPPPTKVEGVVSTQEHANIQKQLADLQAERDQMEAELARLRVQSAPPPPKPTGTYVATPAAKQGPSVRVITADRAVKVGLPRLTTFPNVVTGIVKDGDQNLLPGVLITVKDKDGVPLRALKTNRLGQFAASTPLVNGTYFIEIEDPRLRYTFDRAQITLNGGLVPALEIFAKSQKEITRAKLEKELFGNKPT